MVFPWFEEFDVEPVVDKWRETALPEREIRMFVPESTDPHAAGRRMRVFAALVEPCSQYGISSGVALRGKAPLTPFLSTSRVIDKDIGPLTYSEAYWVASTLGSVRTALASLFLRDMPDKPIYREVPKDYKYVSRDPSLHSALQDLGYEIGEDIREACEAFNNPDVYYPGVDEVIEPVTDEHITLVIWGMQRELNRELRAPSGSYGKPALPAVPLEKLPWRIQRALVERRRLRYLQYGIGREQWENGTWSLWDVMEDPEFVPRRTLRLAAEG